LQSALVVHGSPTFRPLMLHTFLPLNVWQYVGLPVVVSE
jgi:hypothetical protein